MISLSEKVAISGPREEARMLVSVTFDTLPASFSLNMRTMVVRELQNAIERIVAQGVKLK